MSVKILVSLPQEFLDNVDHAAAEEHRSRSELIREALRAYLETRHEKKSRVKTIAEERAAYQTNTTSIQKTSDAPAARTPEQQEKIAKTIALQDEIAHKLRHVKTDSTGDIRHWRETYRGG